MALEKNEHGSQLPTDPNLTYNQGVKTAAKDDPDNYVRSGNRIVVTFGGKIVGLVQSVQLADDYGLEPANRLGSLESVELIPLTANHTITVSLMMLSRDTMYQTSQGDVLVPHSGVSTDTSDSSKSAISGKEMDITVHSVKSNGTLGEPIGGYNRCVYGSGTVDISANRITVSNATFRAVHRWGDFFSHKTEKV